MCRRHPCSHLNLTILHFCFNFCLAGKISRVFRPFFHSVENIPIEKWIFIDFISLISSTLSCWIHICTQLKPHCSWFSSCVTELRIMIGNYGWEGLTLPFLLHIHYVMTLLYFYRYNYLPKVMFCHIFLKKRHSRHIFQERIIQNP